MKKRNYVITLLILSISLTITGCFPRIFSKKHLNIDTLDSISNDIYLNGYYFHKREYDRNIALGDTQEKNHTYKERAITTLFLYTNGYCHYSSSRPPINNQISSIDSLVVLNSYENSLLEFENRVIKSPFFLRNSNNKSEIWNWGIYTTTKDSIYIQYYRNELGLYYLIEQKGEILSKEKYRLTTEREYKSRNSKGYIKNIDKTFEFKEYHPKPDSSNYIMKNKEKFGNNKTQQ